MSKIEEFRSFMREVNVDASVLHTKDEYLNECSEELTKLCGFTGEICNLSLKKIISAHFYGWKLYHASSQSAIGAVFKYVIYKKRIRANG